MKSSSPPDGSRPSEGGHHMERTPSESPSGPDGRPTLLGGENIVLRPLRADDVERVAQIQAEPSVARWWGPPDEAELRRQADGSDDEKAFAIEKEGELVGLIQYHEENEPDFRHAGIDVFLAGRAQGRGLGTVAVRTLARYLIDERGHNRLTIDPAADNAAADSNLREDRFPDGRRHARVLAFTGWNMAEWLTHGSTRARVRTSVIAQE